MIINVIFMIFVIIGLNKKAPMKFRPKTFFWTAMQFFEDVIFFCIKI